ncbi:cytidine deaminase [Halobacillus karajensis]|uniref:Cytidine deaminase n=1 Tax=Halobacillus karajensis TaxID=195088 RepID=A0A024P280_9BACI|nr:cytidine deaminase [Halobacillus karajensis]CDQ19539.1 Cytidine deaminase [Halobacillus karajensis]CDQ22001.1 Cytidine deaminase [Halobacillus karajensis]CDQ27842.1 Cytidine deaminase [Halobacillus karajensis]SEH80598.1 cytidine deaminase [Halobacillus karajensis]
MEMKQLINEAKQIRDKAYTPYSKFPVGAALLTENGDLYTGCNIENAAYPVTCCAERVAIFKAIADGHYKFKNLAVVADTKRPVPPCGSCRQVMSEFFDSDVEIYTTNLHGDTKTFTMEEILPFSFVSSDLPEEEVK